MKAITSILLTAIVLTGCKKERDTQSADVKKIQSITLTGLEDESYFSYDNQGRIAQVEESWGTVQYSYESNKVLIRARRKNKDTDRYTGELTLDAKGRFSKAVYDYVESGSAVEYTFQYNAEGHCNKVTRTVKDGAMEVYEHKLVNGDIAQSREYLNGTLHRVRKYTYYEDKPFKSNYDSRHGLNPCNAGMTGHLPSRLVKNTIVEDDAGQVIQKEEYNYQLDKDGYLVKEIIFYPMENIERLWNYEFK